jgi:hypothetical protein
MATGSEEKIKDLVDSAIRYHRNLKKLTDIRVGKLRDNTVPYEFIMGKRCL